MDNDSRVIWEKPVWCCCCCGFNQYLTGRGEIVNSTLLRQWLTGGVFFPGTLMMTLLQAEALPQYPDCQELGESEIFALHAGEQLSLPQFCGWWQKTWDSRLETKDSITPSTIGRVNFSYSHQPLYSSKFYCGDEGGPGACCTWSGLASQLKNSKLKKANFLNGL